MSDLTVFNFESNDVRIILIDKEPWFVAKDVFDALGISWSGSKVLDILKDSWKMTREIHDSLGRPQTTWFINESAVYKIAFRSNKPEAEEFTDKIASEVIPAIRKTGSYSATPKVNIEEVLDQAAAFASYMEKRGLKPGLATQFSLNIAAQAAPAATAMIKSCAELLGVVESEDNTPLTVTGISELLQAKLNAPIKPQQVNNKLQDLGLQEKIKVSPKSSKWVLTPQGEEFAEAIPFAIKLPNGKLKSDYQLKWNRDVVEILQNNWEEVSVGGMPQGK